MRVEARLRQQVAERPARKVVDVPRHFERKPASSEKSALERGVVWDADIEQAIGTKNPISFAACLPWIGDMFQYVIEHHKIKLPIAPRQCNGITNAAINLVFCGIFRNRSPGDVDARTTPATGIESREQISAATPDVE